MKQIADSKRNLADTEHCGFAIRYSLFANDSPARGIALLVSVILASVVLTVALALLDVTYKQVVLASSAEESEYAFYAADSGMECALYWDQKQDAFDYTNPLASASITCNSLGITNYVTSAPGGTRTTVFSVPCASGGTAADISVSKANTGATNIFATGYSTCSSSDPRRIERGLKVQY